MIEKIPETPPPQTTPPEVTKQAGVSSGQKVTSTPPPTPEELEQLFETALSQLQGKGVSSDVNLDILGEILKILQEMTVAIQRMAKAQAEELNFPTKMQALYTKLMGNVKIYTADDFDHKDLDKNINQANSANQTSSAITERLRMYRDMQGEDAKKMQAAINTSDEAQKSMLEFMQTWLQKQREWLASITRQ